MLLGRRSCDRKLKGTLQRAMDGTTCEIQRKARTERIAIIVYATMAASLSELNPAPRVTKGTRRAKLSTGYYVDSKEVKVALF